MDNKRTIRGMIQEIVIQQTRYLMHYIGKVVNVNDETSSGRVKVSVPLLGWDSESKAPWCFPRDKHSMIVPENDEWVEIYFIAGNKNHPVYMGIANEMKDQLTESYDTNKSVIFEEDEMSILFDRTLKQFIIDNVAKITIDQTLGITLETGDASIWQPSVMGTCPYTGAPHGGAPIINKLKGA